MKRLPLLLTLLTLVWVAALLHRGQPLGWDEIEFFRATRWTAEGQLPYRDFWEHHTPLQWLVFAPVAAVFGGGPGASSIVAMRWAQALLWAATLALLLRFAKREGVVAGRWWALLFLLASPSFVRPALEYRVDALGNGLFVAALALIGGRQGRRGWGGFGALMALAVLANMRLAPLVVVTAAAALFWRPEARRWGWNRTAAWMVPPAAAVAALFVMGLRVAGAWAGFVDGVLRYNLESGRILEVDTFFVTLLAPIWAGDVSGVVFWVAGLAGMLLALREIRRPGPLQVTALVAVASLVVVAMMQVQYEYHFQNAWLLLLPLAGLALERALRWQTGLAITAAGALLLAALPLAGSFGGPMQYQDLLMREVDRRTGPGDRVFDGSGSALRRLPAYRYWFLTTGVRILAGKGLLEPYRIEQDPPAAILYSLRLQRWFEIFPTTADYAVHHYVPLYRNLWIPGLSGVVKSGGGAAWRVPVSGRYRLVASAALTRHPWFQRPLAYAGLQGPLATRYGIPIRRLPPVQGDLIRWRIGGSAVPPGSETVELRRGDSVEVESRAGGDIGVLVLPADVGMLAVGPPEVFEF